jgi:hypothetical protein
MTITNGEMAGAEYVAALRQLADFYESNPGMPVPTYVTNVVQVWTREAFVEGVRIMAHGGVVEKRTDKAEAILHNHHAILRFGKLELDLEISQSLICRKVRRMVEIDVFECPDSLLEPVGGT